MFRAVAALVAALVLAHAPAVSKEAGRAYTPAAVVGVVDVRSGVRISEATILVGGPAASGPPLSLLVEVSVATRRVTSGDVYADDRRVNGRRLTLELTDVEGRPGVGRYRLEFAEAEARALFAAASAAIVTEELRVELGREDLEKVRAAYERGAPGGAARDS